MTETSEATTSAASSASSSRTGGLNSMLLPELKQLAGRLGIKGATTMRKNALIDAIQSTQNGSRSTSLAPDSEQRPPRATGSPAGDTNPVSFNSTFSATDQPGVESPAMVLASVAGSDTEPTAPAESSVPNDTSAPPQSRQASNNGRRSSSGYNDDGGQRSRGSNSSSGSPDNRSGSYNGGQSSGRDGYDDRGGRSRSRSRSRNRDRSYRDRDRRREGGDNEPQVNDDDVLIPAAGILDLLDNYAFVRTSGYLPGPDDVYVAMSMVRRFGLRKGDAITGMVRQHREGERREKYNPMVRIDTVNGAEPEAARSRVDFNKLTPLYASDRLRLETEPGLLTTRLIDIVAPIGKGQRGLIVSPSKAGKTLVMQAIANAITTNNPECHLMVVLVDERPEEVTDMQRAVKGEVVASTFDRPAEDHTTVAELSIERAKRLVELGHDVVVLLDSITRLGRAYNLAAPASGRILSGGVDSSALYPPKRFFGAARNIEDGGSLTIIATALIETGSKMDEVIFEEFKGTGNMELRLRREYADKRIYPAIDVDASGTRREELLMAKDELQIVWKLRRVLSALEGQQALELLLNKLKSTKSNIEFLMQVNKTTPTAAGLRGADDD